jgi:hypothetical protein
VQIATLREPAAALHQVPVQQAICPAGPPKLTSPSPSRSQKREASARLTELVASEFIGGGDWIQCAEESSRDA